VVFRRNQTTRPARVAELSCAIQINLIHFESGSRIPEASCVYLNRYTEV